MRDYQRWRESSLGAITDELERRADVKGVAPAQAVARKVEIRGKE